MNLTKKLVTTASTFRITTPSGLVRHLQVDHTNGNYFWLGPYRLHYLDDRLATPPNTPPTWQTFDGIRFELCDSPETGQ